MNTTTLLTKGILSKKALQLLLPAFAIFFATGMPALSDTVKTSDLVSNAGGPIDDVNPNCAVDIRTNCAKRNPFLKKAWEMDKLDLISSGQSNGDTGDGNGKQGAQRNAVTGASNSGTGSTNSASGNQSNIKKSHQLTEDDQGSRVVAYDAMVKPFGQAGHYLPTAEPEHMPQYASYGDLAVQYAQPKEIAMDKPKTARDMELFQNCLTTFGLPCSDTQFQCIDRENNQRLLELAIDPERFQWMATCQGQLASASAANVLAGSSEAAFKQATNRIVQADGGGGGGAGGGAGGSGGAQVGALINIANEQSGVPTAADNPSKTVPQAVWMVQQMYKLVFLPLAILFLLPGAVMTQVKAQIAQGFRLNADDMSSPFEGILRSVIAIFLIPATQLIVSYSIDIGNSMAYSCKDWVDLQLIFDWSRELTYNTPVNNVNNAITPPGATNAQPGATGSSASSTGSSTSSVSSFLSSIPFIGGFLQTAFNNLAAYLGGTGQGLGSDTPEDKTIAENQTWLSSAMEMLFNMATYLFSTAVIILGAYQLVFICYLFLLGPLAAAFFAWPNIQSGAQAGLFKNVFSNWLNAVIIVSLWRFYWMVILAIMTQRILYIQDSGGASNLQWEVAVFTCLLGLMMYVPFNPWNFDPAAAFENSSAAGQKMMGQASQAMGSAAKAAGVPAGQISAVQNQIQQALAPMAQISQNMELASNGASGYGSQMYNGMGALANTGQGGNSGAPSGQGPGNAPPPPNSSPMSSPTPSVSAPVAANSNSGGPQTAPPTNSGGPSTPGMQLAEASFPGTNVSPAGDTTPLSGGSQGLLVNANASQGDVGNAMNQSSPLLAELGGGGGIPSAGFNSGSGGNDDSGGGGSGSGGMLAMNTSQGSGPPVGGSNDSQISGSGGDNPPGQRDPGNNDTPPPPQAYA